MPGHDAPRSRERPEGAPTHPLPAGGTLRPGVFAAAGPPSDQNPAKPPARKPDEPTSPHHAEHEDPVERAKTAMRKAGERARRIKRPGASGIRGGISQD